MIEYRVQPKPIGQRTYAIVPFLGVFICLVSIFSGLTSNQHGYATFLGIFDHDMVYYPLLLACASCAYGYWLCLRHYAVRCVLTLAFFGFLFAALFLFVPYFAIGYIQG